MKEVEKQKTQLIQALRKESKMTNIEQVKIEKKRRKSIDCFANKNQED